MLTNWLVVGMAIFPRPTKPAPSRFATHWFALPRKGGGTGMGQDFSPTPQTGWGWI